MHASHANAGCQHRPVHGTRWVAAMLSVAVCIEAQDTFEWVALHNSRCQGVARFLSQAFSTGQCVGSGGLQQWRL